MGTSNSSYVSSIASGCNLTKHNFVTFLLYYFGLNASTGTINSNSNYNYNKGITTDASGNILVYDPNYNPALHPVYYQSPNVIIPNPNLNPPNPQPNINITKTLTPVPHGSSSLAYQS